MSTAGRKEQLAAKQQYFWQNERCLRKTQTLSIPPHRISAANSAHDPGLRRDSSSQEAQFLVDFLGWCSRKLKFFLGIWINLNNHHFVGKWRGHFMVCSLFKLNLPLEEKKPQDIWTQESISWHWGWPKAPTGWAWCLWRLQPRTALHLCSTFLHLLYLQCICSDGSLRKNCHLSLDKAL